MEIKTKSEVLSRVVKTWDICLEINGKSVDIEVINSKSSIYNNGFDYEYLNDEEKKALTDDEIDLIDDFISNNFNE